MASNPSVTGALIRQITKRTQKAVELKDWQALKQLDLKVREILKNHPECLKDPALRPEFDRLKATYQRASRTLNEAINTTKVELESIQSQQERAKAYQTTMTMDF
ncbi:hypothetical protein [Grimontia sp. NTOU-MAR1]|uniref:hypothetical protein n=1 Tax=Grimontia sp. NTOU-MAR1 TaxID=3111011 RepID=UPI002DBCF327|nr:hypothetical protein [Grimontia sp. NTOU-MAR1]WRV98736.1 hypothetical protein VP504_04680 [Grimontia sp. NTOU-MAR1]